MGDVTVITSEPGRSTKVYKVRKGKAVTTATRRDLDDAQTLVVDDAGLVRGHRERCASSTAARDLVRREYGPDAHAVVVSLGEDGKSARSFLVEPRSFSAISVDVNPPVLLAAMRRPA